MAQTAAQICTTAAAIAKAPAMTALAGQCLNAALADLCQNYDIDLARGFFQFNFNLALSGGNAIAGAGPYPLPADWLRADYGDVFFMDQGVPHALTSIDLYQWDMMVQQAGLQSYPTLYTTDLSLQNSAVPVMYVYTPPQSAYQVSCRYRRQMPDITTPETSGVAPWFPNSQYLITATAGRLMQITDDDRADSFLGDGPQGAQTLINRWLAMANDNSGRSKTVKLDKRRFGVDQQNLPITKQVWI